MEWLRLRVNGEAEVRASRSKSVYLRSSWVVGSSACSARARRISYVAWRSPVRQTEAKY